MQVTLKSGRAVTISELHQHGTYAGLLAGKPDARMNADHIRRLLTEAKRYGLDGAEPYLIPPAPAQLEARLPAVSCIAVLNSDALQRPGSEPYSSLTVAWYQEHFAPPITASVEQQILAIEWETRAKDWCW